MNAHKLSFSTEGHMEIPSFQKPKEKKLAGIIVKKGNVPEDSLVLEAARELSNEKGVNVVISDDDTPPSIRNEGLPTTIESGNKGVSNN